MSRITSLVSILAILTGSTSLVACGVAVEPQEDSNEEAVTAKVELAGKTYSRTVTTGGRFGAPPGERQHTIKFTDRRTLVDNADTFFGNPPAHRAYVLSGHTVTVVSMTAPEKYTVSHDQKTLTSEAGIVLTLVSGTATLICPPIQLGCGPGTKPVDSNQDGCADRCE